MKKLFVLAVVIAGTLIATSSDAQVYVGARFGRVGVGVSVPVYHRPYYAPAYAPDYAPAPACDPAPAYAPAPAIDYDEFPGYAYYNYPVWNGHYRDRIYYEHYRPAFFREHPRYRGYYHSYYHEHDHDHDRGRRW
ncbi:MAG TPA: hypothetical protein VN616_09775 [Puia sp.]|nr:hypothetical protein [Puia sp.]